MNFSYHPIWIHHTTLYEFLIPSYMNSSYHPLWIPHTILYEFLIPPYMNSSYHPIWIPHTTLYDILYYIKKNIFIIKPILFKNVPVHLSHSGEKMFRFTIYRSRSEMFWFFVPVPKCSRKNIYSKIPLKFILN